MTTTTRPRPSIEITPAPSVPLEIRHPLPTFVWRPGTCRRHQRALRILRTLRWTKWFAIGVVIAVWAPIVFVLAVMLVGA